MDIKKIIIKILLSLNTLIGGIGLIDLTDDIVPKFIGVTDFLRLGLENFVKIRDFALYPLTFIAGKLFGLELLEWFKSYLIIGMLFLASLNMYMRTRNFPLLYEYLTDPTPKLPKYMVIVFFWPLGLIQIVIDALISNPRNHYFVIHWNRGKNLLWFLLAAVLIVFMNWLWFHITNGLELEGI